MLLEISGFIELRAVLIGICFDGRGHGRASHPATRRLFQDSDKLRHRWGHPLYLFYHYHDELEHDGPRSRRVLDGAANCL